jgi:hypothetical protein
MYDGVELQLHEFFTLALAGGEWQVHAPAALPPGKQPIGTDLRRGWVSPRAGLYAVAKRKHLCLCRE